MNLEQQKTTAIQIAEKAFANKRDLADEPYIKHLVHVAEGVQKHGDEFYIVGILHDLLEDCAEWSETALRQIFDEEIVDAIVLLTKAKESEYMNYIRAIKHDRMARIVKLRDLEHNMDMKRLKRPIEKPGFDRFQKYHIAYLELNS